MVAYLKRMPSGIVGDVTRTNGLVVEAGQLTPTGTTGAPTAFGVPLVADTTAGNVGNMRTVNSTDTSLFGILVRAYPSGAAQDPLGVSTPITTVGAAGSIMRRGYMSVLLSGSTPALKGGQVYIWTAAATGTHIVGGYESTNPNANGFALPSTTFEGAADALGVTEIAYNL